MLAPDDAAFTKIPPGCFQQYWGDLFVCRNELNLLDHAAYPAPARFIVWSAARPGTKVRHRMWNLSPGPSSRHPRRDLTSSLNCVQSVLDAESACCSPAHDLSRLPQVRVFLKTKDRAVTDCDPFHGSKIHWRLLTQKKLPSCPLPAGTLP